MIIGDIIPQLFKEYIKPYHHIDGVFEDRKQCVDMWRSLGLTCYQVADGNYCPENCRWATMQEQQNNRTNNRVLEYKGQKKTITAWAKFCGLSYRNLHYRLKNGYSIEQAIEKPKRKLHK